MTGAEGPAARRGRRAVRAFAVSEREAQPRLGTLAVRQTL